MAGVVGFEPTVHDTKNRCLTTWLHPNLFFNFKPINNCVQALYALKSIKVFVIDYLL